MHINKAGNHIKAFVINNFFPCRFFIANFLDLAGFHFHITVKNPSVRQTNMIAV